MRGLCSATALSFSTKGAVDRVPGQGRLHPDVRRRISLRQLGSRDAKIQDRPLLVTREAAITSTSSHVVSVDVNSHVTSHPLHAQIWLRSTWPVSLQHKHRTARPTRTTRRRSRDGRVRSRRPTHHVALLGASCVRILVSSTQRTNKDTSRTDEQSAIVNGRFLGSGS